MEVFEIQKSRVRRHSSTSSNKGSTKVTYLLSIICTILVCSAVLLVLHFFLGYRNLEEALVFQRSVAENLRSPLCDDSLCNSKGCVVMASRMQRLMKPEIDPCTDFYAFSCGGYDESIGYTRAYHPHTQVDEASKNLLIDIRKLMESTSNGNESLTLQKLKQFYNSCVDTGQRGYDKNQSLVDWFTEINFSFDDIHGITWRRLAASLEEYQIHTILRPTFKGSKNIPIERIEVDCELPLLQLHVYSDPTNDANAYMLFLYRELMFDVLNILPGIDASKKREFVDNVLQMETNIARQILISETKESYLSDEYVQNLKDLWSSVLGEAIQETEIVSTCELNLESILSTLNNSPANLSTSYVVWRMLLHLLPHLESGFQALPYTSLPFWKVEQHTFTWQHCSEILRTDLGLPTFVELVKAGYLRTEWIEQIKESFTELKRNFLLTFRSVDWAGALMKKLFLSKVNNMKLNLGYSEIINEPGVIDSLYSNMNIHDNYFKNVLNIKKFKARHYFNGLYNMDSKNPAREVSLESNPLGSSTTYDYTRNAVYIGLGSLRSPVTLYADDIPKYLKFGERIALARQMSHAFDTTGCFFDGKGKIWERIWWPEALNRKYDFFTDCVTSQLMNRTSISTYNNETLNNLGADLGALIVLYYGLNSHLGNFQEEKLLPSLSLSKKQTFYVRAVQNFCESDTSSKRQKTTVDTPSFRVNYAVSNIKEFAEVFNCPQNSNLNPSMKCSFL